MFYLVFDAFRRVGQESNHFMASMYLGRDVGGRLPFRRCNTTSAVQVMKGIVASLAIHVI